MILSDNFKNYICLGLALAKVLLPFETFKLLQPLTWNWVCCYRRKPTKPNDVECAVVTSVIKNSLNVAREKNVVISNSLATYIGTNVFPIRLMGL